MAPESTQFESLNKKKKKKRLGGSPRERREERTYQNKLSVSRAVCDRYSLSPTSVTLPKIGVAASEPGVRPRALLRRPSRIAATDSGERHGKRG